MRHRATRVGGDSRWSPEWSVSNRLGPVLQPVDPSPARDVSWRSRRRVMRVTPATRKETDDRVDHSNSARVTLRKIVNQGLSVTGFRLKAPTCRLVATAGASQ